IIMKAKSIFLIILSGSLLLFGIQNQALVSLNFLWYSFPITLFVLVIAIFLIGLIVGLLIRPKSKVNPTENSEVKILSQEDQDFLSED
ncbi:MAG: hypothetical protein RI952_1747, partial [Bacteroidota bacterium]